MTNRNSRKTRVALLFALCAGSVWGQIAQAQLIDARPRNSFPTRGAGRTPRGNVAVPHSIPGRNFALEAVPEFIEFGTAQNTIDAENLGGPGFAGTFESAEGKSARIEFRSTVGIRLKYEYGDDLKNQNGAETLPTQWETAVLGAGIVTIDGKSDEALSSFQSTPVGTIIDWPGSSPQDVKGVETRVAVTRNGLHDRAGTYKTELVLSWYKF